MNRSSSGSKTRMTARLRAGPLAAATAAVALMLADPGRDTARREALFAQRATAVVTVVPDAIGVPKLAAAERVQLVSEEVDTLSAFVTDSALARVLGARRWKAIRADADAADFTPLELNLAVTIEASAQLTAKGNPIHLNP